MRALNQVSNESQQQGNENMLFVKGIPSTTIGTNSEDWWMGSAHVQHPLRENTPKDKSFSQQGWNYPAQFVY